MEYPKATEIIEPKEFKGSRDLELQIVYQKMTDDYVKVMFLCGLVLCLVILI